MDDRIKILQQTPIFAGQSQKILAEAEKRIKEETFNAQQVICSTGQIGTTMYMVKSGEVKIVIHDQEGKEIVLAYLGRGKYFGEMSLLTGEGRSASAVATLNSSLYVLEKEDFDYLIEKNPVIAVALSRVLAERLKNLNYPPVIRRPPPKLLSLLSPLPTLVQKNFAYLLARAIKKESGKKVVFVDFNFDAPDILSLLNLPSESHRIKEGLKTLITQSALEFEKNLPVYEGLPLLSIDRETFQRVMSSGDALSTIMGLVKERFSFVVMDCGNSNTKKTSLDSFLHNKCCAISDLILYYLSSLQDVNDANLFLERNENVRNNIAVIAQRLTDSNKRELPETYRLLKKEPAYRLSLDRDSLNLLKTGERIPLDMRRVARRISGVSVGVAIGSGGARGMAGIGVLAALENENIPIDLIAGSSMGAVVAAFYSLGKNAEENRQLCQKGLSARFSYNPFPLGNLLNPKHAFSVLKKTFGDLYLEELNIPTYIIAADLITSRQVLFSQGPIYTSVIASSSIPILFPPAKGKDTWLVDGGIINSVPGDVVKEKGAGVSIAVNVTKVDADDIARGEKGLQSKNKLIKLIGKIPLFRNYLTVPTIPNIATRALYIPNQYLIKTKQHLFDFYLEPEVMHYSTFDAKPAEEIVELGLRKAYEFIPEIKKKIRELKQS